MEKWIFTGLKKTHPNVPIRKKLPASHLEKFFSKRKTGSSLVKAINRFNNPKFTPKSK